MILWIIFAAITLATLGLLLSPLLHRHRENRPRMDYDLAVYRDQLEELYRDTERGLLNPDQAEAARTEIYRRMLLAEDAESQATPARPEADTTFPSQLAFALIIVVLLPLGSGLLYSFLGAPELPGKPYAVRKNDPDFVMAGEAQTLAARLESKPDAEGYKHLADIYFLLRRYDQAVDVYDKIIEMNGGDATIWSELGEVIALSHEALVVPEARAAFIKALRLDPTQARARFYMGLSETQIGEFRRAVAIWRDLEKDGPPDAPWMSMLKEQIAFFSKEGGFAAESVPPAPPTLTQDNSDAASAIMALPPDTQQAMIHKMVDSLAVKMKDNPNDLEGWTRLAHAYRVLGETDKAQAAEKHAAALKARAAGNASPAQ